VVAFFSDSMVLPVFAAPSNGHFGWSLLKRIVQFALRSLEWRGIGVLHLDALAHHRDKLVERIHTDTKQLIQLLDSLVIRIETFDQEPTMRIYLGHELEAFSCERIRFANVGESLVSHF